MSVAVAVTAEELVNKYRMRLYICQSRFSPKQRASANQLVYGFYTEVSHYFPKLLCGKAHEVFHIFRLPAETAAQIGILCGNTHRAGIKIAYTHHHTPHGNQRRRGKPEFFCTENSCNCNIPAGEKLPVCLQNHSLPQAVFNKCAVGLGKSKLPWQPCIVDGASRCRTGSSVITGNQDDLCPCFCNA